MNLEEFDILHFIDRWNDSKDGKELWSTRKRQHQSAEYYLNNDKNKKITILSSIDLMIEDLLKTRQIIAKSLYSINTNNYLYNNCDEVLNNIDNIRNNNNDNNSSNSNNKDTTGFEAGTHI